MTEVGEQDRNRVEDGEVLQALLTGALTRAHEMQKYGEAKNATILALNTAWLVALATSALRADGIPAMFAAYVPLASMIIALSAFTALVAFAPRASTRRSRRKPAGAQPNLLYFGDVASLPLAEFQRSCSERYTTRPGGVVASALIEDLAAQVHTNSVIALRKFRLFMIASYLSLAALIVLAAPVAIYVVKAISTLHVA